ncbi:MAG: hypothetical protein MGF17_12680 [Trichodesmium sp. MAG_R04]|nr:hypothetical protein [Trichodesmium sp. MAG_R04]
MLSDIINFDCSTIDLTKKNNIAYTQKTNLCDISERRCLLARSTEEEKLLSLLKEEWKYIFL